MVHEARRSQNGFVEASWPLNRWIGLSPFPFENVVIKFMKEADYLNLF